MWRVIWRVRCDTEKHWLVTSCCHTIAFSDLVDLWVIKMKKPMILCARSTSRSREQSTKRRSRSENMWKVCYFYGQNKKIAWLSNMADRFLEKFMRCAKVHGLFFLDCSFRMLIGWAGRLRSRGSNEETRREMLLLYFKRSFDLLTYTPFSPSFFLCIFSSCFSLSHRKLFVACKEWRKPLCASNKRLGHVW